MAATLQTAFTGTGLFAGPGDLLRQWPLLGPWAGPAGTPVGDWFLYRAADALMLAAVCATVLGLLVGQLVRMALTVSDSGMRWGLVQLSAGIGGGVPAALTFGLVAGAAAAVTLRVAGGGWRVAGGRAGTGGAGALDGTWPGPAEPGPDVAGSAVTGPGPDLRPQPSPNH
ncbi:hypothetical protein ACK8N7_16715 [Streptomyces griseobrunneus]|uniref:hypothetical protein n=1 Tax=Streptomyces microflavus TaxID=1919 RepID=UPI003803D4FE